MRRRATVLGMGGWGALAASGASAQMPGPRQPRRIGVLSSTDAETWQSGLDRLTAELKALGYVVGRDIVFEFRHAHRDPTMLPKLAQELVALQPAVIVAGDPALAVLKQATHTIPIVMFAALGPEETGLVASLAHPGGNITGVTFSQPALGAKRLEVLKAAAPRISRVAIFQNPDIPGMRLFRPQVDRRAVDLGVQLLYVDVRRADDFRIETLERLRPDAFIVTYDYAVQAITKQLIQIARERKLPSAGVTRQFVELGGLLSLGPDLNELDAATAGYIDRILRGASPATLPVRMPSRFQLVISRKTAAIIGLRLSPELLLRADEVID